MVSTSHMQFYQEGGRPRPPIYMQDTPIYTQIIPHSIVISAL